MDRPSMDRSKPPVVSLVSLGCSKNQVDSERIVGAMVTEGFLLAEDPADADIALVNTCAFLESARKETRDMLSELQALKKRSGLRAVVALGCYPSKTASVPGADAVVPFSAYRDLPNLCRRLLRLPPPASRKRPAPPGTAVLCRQPPAKPLSESADVLGCGPRLRFGLKAVAYLKISEGCSNSCAYCAIPSIRGSLRSRPMKDVLREAQDLVTDGASELVLVAQDTAAYGRDRAGSGRPSLDGLMTGLLGIRGFRWLRLMYAHPAHLTDDIIELLSEKRVARYLDLPIQHADDGVLAAMNRPYGSAHLRGLIAKLRRKVPGIALRTTCLVGFPGETTKAFRNLMDFARESCFDHLGAFAYSREPGTAAARLSGQVDEKTKAERLDRLMSLQKTCSRKAGTARVGQTLEVLVEKVGPESVEGRSQFQAPEVDGKTIVSGSQAGLKRLKPGAFCKAKVTAAKDYDLAAEMI